MKKKSAFSKFLSDDKNFLHNVDMYIKDCLVNDGNIFVDKVNSASIDELTKFLLAQIDINIYFRNSERILESAYILQVKYFIVDNPILLTNINLYLTSLDAQRRMYDLMEVIGKDFKLCSSSRSTHYAVSIRMNGIYVNITFNYSLDTVGFSLEQIPVKIECQNEDNGHSIVLQLKTSNSDIIMTKVKEMVKIL